MYSSTTSKQLIGIADPAWPESAPIEKLVMASGYEALVSSRIESFTRQKDLKIVVAKLEVGSSLQSMIEAMRAFGDDVQFVIRANDSDLQTITTLARVPGVHIVDEADFTEGTWKPILGAQNTASPEDPKLLVDTTAPQTQTLDFVFVDPKSQHLLALIKRLAVTKAAVLLEGATGSGKEVLARTLHELSDRSGQPFVALNCAALPEQLVEDMLFGHEKGAFTGASRESAGVFEQAQGGTVFLDEIGEMPIQLQAKLLRVLQEKEVVRLGGRHAMTLDFRLVAATNKDLKVGISEKTFREDLYYRISAFKLKVPALADRPGDIVPLVNSLASKHGCPQPEFSESALRQLFSYHWPGNVRELDNVIQRAIVFADYGRIDAEHIFFDDPMVCADVNLSQVIKNARSEQSYSPISPLETLVPDRPRDLQSAVRASEYDVIMDAIRSTRTREEAARKLGISPRTLRYKMAKLKESSSGLSHCA